ncbi:MAG: T9SS type A sorting domain-containing protein [Bacteroidota bacterium]
MGFQQLNEGFAGQQWYYAEGMMAYDPCVCDYETGIVTEAVTTDISQLQFSGDISGQSQAVYSTPSSSGSKSFLGNAIRRADGLAGAIAGGYKRYKTLDSLESDLDLENSSSGFVRTLADFLPTGFLGPVGGALKVIGFLAGKKKPATPPQLLGFNHNFSFTATGTITSTSRYSPYPMYSPGSDFNEQQLQAFRPIYDNPLGVFTVLERPKVQFYEEEFLNGTLGDLDFGYVERGFYRFSGDLKYRVNKTAGLSELPVSVAAALIWTDGCQAFDNGVADSVASVAGPAINLACFDDQIVRIGTINGVSGLNGFRCSGSPQIQIIATLEEEDGDIQTLFAARYPVELEEIKAEDVDWTLGVAAQLDPNPASYCISDAPPLPVNDQELFQFCRSRYDPILTLVVGPEDEEDSSLETGLTGNVVGEIQSSIASDVFPNPVRDRLWLGIPDELVNQNVLFTLTDMSGRILIQTNRTFTVPGKNMLPIEWNEYTPGLYLITISDGENYLQTFRVTKQ